MFSQTLTVCATSTFPPSKADSVTTLRVTESQQIGRSMPIFAETERIADHRLTCAAQWTYWRFCRRGLGAIGDGWL